MVCSLKISYEIALSCTVIVYIFPSYTDSKLHRWHNTHIMSHKNLTINKYSDMLMNSTLLYGGELILY